jgi:hypothetical protein
MTDYYDFPVEQAKAQGNLKGITWCFIPPVVITRPFIPAE